MVDSRPHEKPAASGRSKRERRFRYYVCRAARQKGWDCCPTKSVAAALIEEAVVAQLRAALTSEAIRQQLQIPDIDWQCFLQGNTRALVAGIVERIDYDGRTGAVTVQLGSDGQQP